MLDGEGERVVAAAQIQVAVAPGVKLRGAAQRLAVAQAMGGLAGVMHDQDGELMAALQFAQIGEQRGDFATGVLVDAVQTHERVEDEQPRLERRDGVLEAGAIGTQVQTQRGGGDDLDVQIAQRDAGGGADAVEALAHDGQSVLCGVQQHPAGTGDGEAAQARGAGRHGDGKLEGHERLAGFRLAAEDADCLLGPQFADQPALLGGAGGQAVGRLDGQQGHDHRPAPPGEAGAGAEKVSRNSFSSRRSSSRCAATASNSPAMFISVR